MGRGSRSRLPGTILALGLTSLLTDVSTEMIFPLLPLFLVGTLHASPAFLGLVDGCADTVSSLLKLASGYFSDRLRRRKPLVLLGYGLAGAVRPLVALATASWHVLGIRVVDRIGKGLRTAPRDALIAESALPGGTGRAFGFHSAMDHAGSVIGPLAATGLLAWGISLRNVFWFAALPAALAFVVLLFVREKGDARKAGAAPAIKETAENATTATAHLPRRLTAYLGILLLFSLGNSSDAFLLLRARDLGLSDSAIPALWTLLHVVKAGSSYYSGTLSDHVPRSWLILAGWIVYGTVYLALGVVHGTAIVWPIFAVYGLYHGLTEPAEKALVRDLAPPDQRGRAYGAYNFVVGIAALPAGLLTGWLWRTWDAQVAFAVGAGTAGLAAILLAVWTAATRLRT